MYGLPPTPANPINLPWHTTLIRQGCIFLPKGPKDEFSQDLNPVKTSLEDSSSTPFVVPSKTFPLPSLSYKSPDLHGETSTDTLGEDGYLCLAFILTVFDKVVWGLYLKSQLGWMRLLFFGLWHHAPSSFLFCLSSDWLCHSITHRGVSDLAGA